MASSIIPDVQILDQNDTWQSVISGLMSCQIEGGMAAGASKPQVGRCDLQWWNADQSKNPDPAGGTAALLRARRRIRVTATSGGLGNLLQVRHTGAWSSPGTATAIVASGALIPVPSPEVAQQIIPTAGIITQIIIHHGPDVNGGSGLIHWAVYSDNNGKPGSQVLSGTYTPTPNADNVINTGGSVLADGMASYWIAVGYRDARGSGYSQWQASTANPYPAGKLMFGDGFTHTWATGLIATAQCSMVTAAATCENYWSQVVTTGSSTYDVWVLQWEARAAFDSVYNTDQVRLVTNNQTGTKTAYTYTNKWQTFTLSLSITFNATTIAPQFFPAFVGNGNNSTAIEYRNLTLKKNGGANVLVNGDLASSAVSPWASTDVGSPAGSNALAVIRDYRILFNGKISRIEPAPFQRAGDKTCHVIAVDFVDGLQRRKVTGLALQKNQRGDQLVATAAALLPQGNAHTTYPGKLLDTGKQVFSKAFDGYSKSTALFDAITDCAVSEYGLWWIDPDGTIRWAARDYPPKRSAATVALTLAGGDANTTGQPFNMLVAQDAANVINKAVLTWHPRNTVSTGVVLGQVTSAVAIPPIQADGSPGTMTVTLTYRDPATQKLCGGDNVSTPLVATTDYIITDNATYPGGYNYTNSIYFGIEVVSVDASQITVKLKNLATGTLYANKLQVRGDAVVTYDPQTLTYQDDTAIANDDESAWTKDLPFNDNQNFVTSLGQYLVNKFKTPFDTVEWVSVDWRSSIGGVDVLSIQPLDVLSITDVQTGMTSPAKHLVTHWAYQFTPQSGDYIGNVQWGLERLDDTRYFILDNATFGKLDTGRLFL